MKEVYAICGASGYTGCAIAKKLLDKGKHVRVIARLRDPLNKLLDKGAESCLGDMKDPKFIHKAFSGAKAAYIFIPPYKMALNVKDYQNGVMTSLIEGIKQAGVKYVVALSSIGAHLPQNTGFVLGLHEMEERLKRLEDTNVLILRSACIMERLEEQLDLIEKRGYMASTVLPDVRFPLVSLRDVADMAAARLLAFDFNGFEIMEVLGPRDVSYNEIAEIMGRSLGISDLKYKHLAIEEMKSILVESGIAENVAESFIEFEEALNSGDIQSDYQRNPENTTHTTLEEYSNDLARKFKEFVAVAPI